MAQIANVTLKNAANVDVPYVPDTCKTGEYAKYVNRDQGSFVGTSYASMTRKINPSPTGTRKIQAKVSLPIVDATTGLLKYQLLGTVEWIIPNAAVLADRQGLNNRLKAFAGSAAMTLAVESDEMPFG